MSIFIVNDNGRQNTYFSPMLHNNINDNININDLERPPAYQELYQDIIDKISYMASGIGIFSSKRIGVDELDDTLYDDNEEKLRTRSVRYSETIDINFPYNNIICHDKNMWKFRCLEKDFWIKYNIIPFTSHDLPSILNFRRSNGSVQRGRVYKNEGLIIKQIESFDNKYNLYE